MPIQTLSLFTRSTALSVDGNSLVSEPPENPKSSNEYHPQNDIPDIEIMPLATSAMDNLAEHEALFSKIGVFSLLATLLQPKSRGSVRLADSNPHSRPKVDFGILSAPEDYEVARTAVRLSLKMGQMIKETGFPLGRNLVFPDEAQRKDEENGTTEEMDKFIRHRIRTCFHYSSSCRMAPEKGEIPGVVDDELRVHGVSGLRVCDASVFPQIISSHLQAPTVMVAERCAEWIKEGLKA
jgi:choline dehydrogenase-like flavoprotein